MISFGCSLNNVGVVRDGWSPSDFFGGSRKGGLYEPWDLSTLFQDSFGTTPVTGPDQTVGLMLDKRLWGGRDIAFVLMEQPELISNGDFAAGATDWSLGASWNVVDGKAVKFGVGTDTIYQDIPALIVGQWYVLEYDQTVSGAGAGAGLGLLIRVGAGGAVVINSAGISPPRARWVFQATAAATRVSWLLAGSTFTGTLDNISLKRLPGNHLSQATSGARPKLGRHPVGGRRNLLPYSEDFTNRSGGFGFARIPLGLSSLGPTFEVNTDIGLRTFTPLIEDGSTGTHELTVGANSFNGLTPWPGDPSVFSWLVKKADRRYVAIRHYSSSPYREARFDLDNPSAPPALSNGSGAGNFSAAWVEDIGGGVLRLCVQPPGAIGGGTNSFRITGCDAAGNTSYTGTGGTIINAGGVQFELGLAATPYQKVVSAFDVSEQGVRDCWYIQGDGVDDNLRTADLDFSHTSEVDVIAAVDRGNVFNAIIAEFGQTFSDQSWYISTETGLRINQGGPGSAYNSKYKSDIANISVPFLITSRFRRSEASGPLMFINQTIPHNGQAISGTVSGNFNASRPISIFSRWSGSSVSLPTSSRIYGLMVTDAPIDDIALCENYFARMAGINT